MEADLTAKVDVTELMGNEIFLYCIGKDSKQFIARVDPRVRVSSNDQIVLAANMANAHIFDPKTEITLGS
jgi:multiple sugar transport system ATP-binding protein